MATITVYPNGDGSKGSGWSDAASGTTNLYQSIDEGTGSPNDSDFVSGNTSNSTIFFLFDDMPGDFGTLTGYSLKVRLNHTSTKGDYHYLTSCQLFKADESTAIASSHSISSSSTPTTYTFSTTPTFTDKTSWDGVRVKFTVSNSSGGGSGRIYAAQLDLTYTTSGNTYNESGSGGATSGGSSILSVIRSLLTSGGTLAGGSASVSTSADAIEGTGGTVAGGSATLSHVISIESSGGVSCSGESLVQRIRDGEGGVIGGGSATVQILLPCSTEGLVLNSAALRQMVANAWSSIDEDFDVLVYTNLTLPDQPIEDDFDVWKSFSIDKEDFLVYLKAPEYTRTIIDGGISPEYSTTWEEGTDPDSITGYAVLGQTSRQVWWSVFWGIRTINESTSTTFNVRLPIEGVLS